MGTALLAVPSCTDTWTEHYQTEDSYTANETLWELLESREELSKFSSIVAKAKFYRDEHHAAISVVDGDTSYYTFKDILSANLPVTVWAPKNEALTEEDWNKYEAMAENDGYNLQQQFLGNHIALYRKTMTKTGKETFRLINSKFATIDYDNAMLQKSKVDVENMNIGASNGLLHVLESKNDFLYNLYEYIKFSGEVETFSKYLVKRDTTYFKEDASIEGLPDENGNPTYVDSVYFQDNMMFNRDQENPTSIDATDAWINPLKMFRAQLNTEDSVFVMVVPTDLAWETVTNKFSPYYKYVSAYPRMDKVNQSATKGVFSSIYGARPSYTTGKGYETVDSLQNVNIDMDIVRPLVFNLNLQPQIAGKVWTINDFINEKGYEDCEFLLTTVGDTIRDVYEDGVLVWSKNSLFENVELKEMSNGYALISDKWNYPRQYWMRDIDVDAGVNNMYEKSTATRLTDRDMNNTLAASWIDEYGRVSEQRYLSVAGQATSTNPEVTFGLKGSKQGDANVMSGKYDVQIVLVPRWYETSEAERDTTAAILKNRLICTLYYWDEALAAKADPKANPGAKLDLKYTKQIKLESDKIEYTGEKVDTITVLTDVEFPVSYKNLIETYPVLNIRCDKLSNNDVKDGYSRAFNIDRIILKSKEPEL